MERLPKSLVELPLGFRVGFTFLCLVLGGGLVASATHLVGHHENRDERPGLSMEDLTGAYHGVKVVAPMLTALERGHPEDLAEPERDILLGWLRGDRISEDYDNLDLGDASPAEILDRACLSCHSRQSEDPIGQEVPLEYWDDVEKLSFSRELSPVSTEILVASAHTHALGMGVVTLAIGLLALFTRWPSKLTGALFALAGLGLAADLACWFLARSSAALVPVLAASGGLWMACTALLLAVVLADLWLPARR
jgi:hypothetical protein